ncbi:MAG TPA: hypothetical protein VFJ97_11860 [Dermatophilaceae bacterium]|nr:hypothetical protein [Dermatophilaceae bacterium]
MTGLTAPEGGAARAPSTLATPQKMADYRDREAESGPARLARRKAAWMLLNGRTAAHPAPGAGDDTSNYLG